MYIRGNKAKAASYFESQGCRSRPPMNWMPCLGGCGSGESRVEWWAQSRCKRPQQAASARHIPSHCHH
ncbi:hypothetical protein ACIP02_10100 [Pseudomonas sp. NPDC089408]|uniref:hypothetical protein n=1 Tax=Pseudomonas sp. NPDC089408 TaxID=3364465 RepID=UPI0037F64C7B